MQRRGVLKPACACGRGEAKKAARACEAGEAKREKNMKTQGFSGAAKEDGLISQKTFGLLGNLRC